MADNGNPLNAIWALQQSLNSKNTGLDYLEDQKEQAASRLNEAKYAFSTALELRKYKRDTWAGQAGFELNTIPGAVINNVASAVAGTANLASTVLAIPDYLQAGAGAVMSDETYQAYARYSEGKASAQDMALLNEPLIAGKGPTPLQRIENAQQAYARAQALRKGMDVSGIVNKANQGTTEEQMDAALASPVKQIERGWESLKNYDEASGWKNIAAGGAKALVAGAKTLADNPGSVLEMASENLPQFVAGGAGKIGKGVLGMFNLGYSAEIFNKGVEDFKKANGRMPSEGERLEIGAKAATAGGAEYLSSVKVGESLSAAAKEVARNAKRDIMDVLGTGLKETVESVASEGFTEGLQTYMEETADLSGPDVSKVIKGTLYGGAVGGAVRGGAASVEFLDAARNTDGVGAPVRDNAPAPVREAVVNAFANKNVDVLLDPNQKATFNPAAAMGVLHSLASDAETTAEEKLGYQAKAKQALDLLERNAKALRGSTDEGIKKLQSDLAAAQAELKTLDPSDTSGIQDQKDYIDFLTQTLEAEQQAKDPEAGTKLKKAEQALADAQAIYDRMIEESTTSVGKTDVDATLAEANDPDRTKATAAVQKAMVLSMVSPESMKADDALALAKNTSNSLTSDERAYFTKFAEAAKVLETAKTMAQVQKEVLEGDRSRDQKGLLDYQKRFGQFLAGGDTRRANGELAGLRKFMESHKAKGIALRQAIEMANAKKTAVAAIKDSSGAWKVEPTSMDMAQVRDQGGYFITPNSKPAQNFLKGVRVEYQAMVALRAAMEAGYKLKSAPQAATPQTTVQTPAQAPVVAQEQAPEVQPVQEAANETAPITEAPVAETTPEPVTEPAVAPEPDAAQANEAAEIERALAKAEKEYNRVRRSNPASLYSAVKHKLIDSDLNEIYGSEWKKRYTALKGKNGKALVDLITEGSLDDFLPVQLRFGNGDPSVEDAESQAREHIIEKLRNRDYLTEQTSMDLRIVQATIDALHSAFTQEDIENEFKQAQADLRASEQGGIDSPVSDVASGSEDASVDRTDAAETAGTDGSTDTDSGSESGKLTALQDSDNPLSTMLKQSTGGDAAVSKRPLAAVKDFISAWMAGTVKVEDFLKEALTDEQKNTLRVFNRMAREWHKAVPSVLRKADVGFEYKNPASYLMSMVDGKEDLDENVKTAMTLAVMSWIGDADSRGLINEDEDINQILFRDEDHFVSREERALLRNKGPRRAVIANAIGQKIVQALGIKATAQTPQDLVSKLEAGLGLYALQVARDKGLVVYTVVPGQEFKELTKKDASNTYADQWFVQLKRTNGVLDPEVQKLIDAQKGSKGVLEKLFSVEREAIAPSFEPVAFTQKKAKDSKMNVPKELAKVLSKKNKEENRIIEDAFNIVAQIAETDEQLVLDMVGAAQVDPGLTHKANRKANEAKNMGLARELRNIIDFVSNEVLPSKDGLKTPFFFEHVVWKNQRVGIRNNMVNPQTSKLHRYLIARPSWLTTVDKSNSKDVEAFKLRVLEGFGVKTDKQANKKSLTEWEGKTETPAIKAAVAAIQASLSGAQLTPEQKIAIANGVKEAGQKMHSFNALIALAKFQAAEQNGKFDVHLLGEVDGVTNGPMLTHILLGAASTVPGLMSLINRGGFFELGSKYVNYNLYRGSDQAMDLYEVIASKIIANVQDSPALQALYHFTGRLDTDDKKVASAGRNIVKKPITALMFGSGLSKVAAGMRDSFIEAIYEKIEATAHDDVQRAATIKAINTLLGGRAQWNTSMSAKQILEREFRPNELAAINDAFEKSLGEVTKEVMAQEFKPLIERRNKINSIAKVTHALYASAYASLKHHYVDVLASKGEIPAYKGRAKWDLSAEQQATLDRLTGGIFPMMHTAMSKRSNDLRSGLAVMKTKRKLSTDPQYHAKVTIQKTAQEDRKTVGVNGQALVTENPGVFLVPGSAHSSDSAASHEAAAKTEALNIHDAHVTGMGNFTEVARNLNKAAWNTLLEYSPTAEAYEAFARTVDGVLRMLENKELAPVIAYGLRKQLNKLMADKFEKFDGSAEDFLIMKLTEMKYEAYQADLIRLGALAQMEVVDQYALEGGQYKVTEEDRANAQRRLDALTMEVSGELIDRVKKLSELLPEDAVGRATNDVQTATEEIIDIIKTSPFGKIGKPVVAPAVELVRLFEQAPEMTGKDLAKKLVSYLNTIKGNSVAEGYQLLTKLAYKSLGDGVKVKYVKPGTQVDSISARPEAASRGWFVSADNTIYVLSPDHQESGLTTEMLVHELTHAALFNAIENPTSQTQKELVKELQAMMQAAKEFVAQNGLTDTGFAEATSNIHEFVAWGLTNRNFQAKVLGQFSVPDRRGVLTKALQAFINKLTGLLLNKRVESRDGMVDAMTGLVANVSAMYQEISNHKQQQEAKTNKVLSMVSPSQNQQIDEYTTQQLFDALDGTGNSSKFIDSLDTLINDVVTKFHGPFGIVRTKMLQIYGTTAQDVWANMQAAGMRPFASKVLAANLKFSQKEAFAAEQVEAGLRAMLEDKASANSPVYREIEKLYEQAKTELKGKIDQDLYKFLFLPQKGADGKSDYMSRFVALGLTHEGFNQALAFETRKPQLVFKGKTFMERLEMVWRAVSDWIGSKMTGTVLGQQANEKLHTLAMDLVQIEARHKGIHKERSMLDFLQPLEDKASELVKSGRKTVANVASSKLVSQSRFLPVRVAGVAAKIVANDRVDAVIEGMNKMRNQLDKTSAGTLMGTVNYVAGIKEWANKLLLGAKQVEKHRLEVINDAAKAVLHAFADNGEKLTTKQKASISAVLLRTGAHTLLDTFGSAGILKLLESPAAMQKAIQDELAKLHPFGDAMHYYDQQAKGLAFYRATGQVALDNQMLNAFNIARLHGTGRNAPQNADQAEASVARLVTLYALSYTKADVRATAVDLMRSELDRGKDNGIDMTLLMHKALDKQAREKLFAESEALMIHGYTPETLNPKVTFEVARDQDEIKALKNRGYVVHSQIGLDPKDPDKRDAVLMVLRGGGMNRRLTSMVSFTGMDAKGAQKHSQFYSNTHPKGMDNVKSMRKILAANSVSVQNQFKPNPGFDPFLARKKHNYMLPVVNAHGEIRDYRYVMSEKNKDEILERNNNFEHVLGAMAGATYDKVASRDQNKVVMQALREHYEANYGQSPSDFIQVHHTSQDPRMKEIWDMLPSNTKEDIRQIWGSEGLWVPKNMVDVIFGYRKYSLAEAFDKANPNAAEKVLVDTTRYFLRMTAKMQGKTDAEAEEYAKRGAVTIRRIEDGWQEIVHEVKDFIVVKTGTVLVGNILSNINMLAMKGVPFLDGLKWQHEALMGAMNYERDRAALAQLQALVDTGYGSASMDEVRAEMVRLEDSIARNPVKELIDSGLMPTIVEDISMEDNPYSYKSLLTDMIDQKTAKLNKHVLQAGKFVYMTHDTVAYKFLSKTTQYSDFVARYAMYKHLTTRSQNPLSKDAAVFEASEAFVNYDVPLPKSLQYLDDMGLIPFIKYFLSIQRVLARNFKDNPLRVLSVISMNSFLGNLPMPTDSSFLFRIGNNLLSIGAIGYPSAVMEAATIQGSLSLLK